MHLLDFFVGAFSKLLSFFVFLFAILMIQRRYLVELNKLGGRSAMLFPAAIFVPIHEMSHALAALLMGHKIKSIVFFQINNAKTLGYVEHSYKITLLSPLSNMVIGMAPLVGGGFTCYWLTYWLMPELLVISYSPQGDEWLTFLDIIATTKATVNIMMSHLNSGVFWLWLFLIVNAATFNVPSGADFEGAKDGVIVTLFTYLFLSYLIAGSTSPIDDAITSGLLLIMPLLIVITFIGSLVVASLALTNKTLGRAN